MMQQWQILDSLLLRIFCFTELTFYIPPGKRGQEQFTKAGVQKTKTIANLRIFVGQAIRRLKTFRIMKNELPISLIGNLYNIIVCAALFNLYKPLCK